MIKRWLQSLHSRQAVILEALYYETTSSIPSEHESDIHPIVHGLCQSRGIHFPPELRIASILEGDAGEGDAGALVSKNAILFTEELLVNLQPSLEGIIAHELAHLIFGDDTGLGKRQEYRADRFVHFLTRNPSAFISHILSVHEENEIRIAALIAHGESARALKFKSVQRTRYGLLEERIENIRRPISAEEEKFFAEAIERYNKKMAAHQHSATPSFPLIEPYAVDSWPEPTTPRDRYNRDVFKAAEAATRIMERLDAGGDSLGALRAAKLVERILQKRVQDTPSRR